MANIITDETIEYVGILAKLELSEDEREAAKKDMGRMLDYIDKHKMQIAGFSREVTLIDYGITNDTEKFVTEICIPVKPVRYHADTAPGSRIGAKKYPVGFPTKHMIVAAL